MIAIITIVLAADLWSRRIPKVDGMVYFPKASFLAGPDKKSEMAGAYYLGETEVTNREFDEFCRATHCSRAEAPSAAADLPVVNVTAADARAYARSKGWRLPTALEWEHSVRSVDGVLFPWGDAMSPALANVADSPNAKHALIPVRNFRPLPVYQSIGNAWEMVEAEVQPSPGDIARFAKLLNPPPDANEKWIEIRGGSFNTPLADAMGYKFQVIPERYAAPDIGFRCAKSLE